jgi:hypothetical protein
MAINKMIHGRIVFCWYSPWILAAAISVLNFSLCGCSGDKRPTFLSGKRTPKTGQISKEELRRALNNFEEYTASVIKQASDELDILLPGVRTQRTNLLQRARLSQGFSAMLEQKDPIIAFVETWGLCVRYRIYMKEGEGSKLFGEHQYVAVVAAERIEQRIEQIGREFLKEDIFLETREQVQNFARQNPITGTFSNVIIFATEARPGQPSAFDNVLSIPMAPFSAMKGVDRTATAISDARGSLDRISDVVQDLPESARWQLLLLLLEMEDIEAVKIILTSMTKLSDSSVKLADSAEKLPEKLREQISILVEDIDSKQANIQTTLEQGEKTAIAVDKAFSTAGQTIETTGQAAKNVDEAAEGWENAVDATSELVQLIRQWIDEMPKKEPSEKTSVSDYKDTARGVTDAANELRSLVTDVRGLLESEALSGHIEDVNNRVVGALDQSAVNAQSVTDHITWRIIQLAGVIFVMALLYRFVAGYFKVKPRQ